MKETDALTRVAKMFHAHARLVGSEIVGEYAEAVLDADCQSCMAEVVEQVRTEGSKVPPVSGLWALYRDRRNSANHHDHIGQDEQQVDVGKLEADWRMQGVDGIKRAGGNENAAKLAAARMWASGAVALEATGDEWLAGIWGATTPDYITPELIEAAWDYARAIATKDPLRMTDAEWTALTAPYQRAIDTAEAAS